jgi:predicted nuclease with TOPRIM domain
MERDQNKRVQDAMQSIQGLRNAMDKQQQSRSVAEVRVAELIVLVKDLRQQVEMLRSTVQDRDEQLGKLRTEHGEVLGQLSVSKAATAEFQVRWVGSIS